jgi:fructokinase
VVLGESLFDLFVDDEGKVHALPGGAPLNAARTIARLGQKASLLCGMSSDAFGTMLRSVLEADGVDLALSDRVNQPTTLAVVQISDGVPHYSFHLHDTAAFELRPGETLAFYQQRQTDIAALYVGSLGLLIEPMASSGAALIDIASPSTLVVIDPNCRPNAVENFHEYRQHVTRLFARSDVVKVSVEDLAYLSPDRSISEAVSEILERGATWVVVTDGPHHVHVHGQSIDFNVNVPTVEVVDTVGAGDGLVGGFLAWWVGRGLRRSDLEDVDLVRRAVQAAVIISSDTCTRRGAQPPSEDDVRGRPGWEWL